MSGELLSVLNSYLVVLVNAAGNPFVLGIFLLIFILGMIFVFSRSFEITIIAGLLSVWILYAGNLLPLPFVLIASVIAALVVATAFTGIFNRG